jgi:hypothetical protein
MVAIEPTLEGRARLIDDRRLASGTVAPGIVDMLSSPRLLLNPGKELVEDSVIF